MGQVVVTRGLKKSFPTKQGVFEAVRGVDLQVVQGEIFGFLGPNGAGKTTTLRMLTTLLDLDGGEAIVAGFDVQKTPWEVRKRIGYVSQAGGVDRDATGLENLILQGRLYGMSFLAAKQRAEEVMRIFALEECADKFLSAYSGGQKRRIEIGLGIMHRPEVLFLDEPSTGLDPHNRANLWQQIRVLREEGTTIFLTSHYLDEIDYLSDRLAIMDHGQIVAEGNSRDLKKQIAGDVITIGLTKDMKSHAQTIELLQKHPSVRNVMHEEENMHLYVEDGGETMPHILRFLDTHKIDLKTISLSLPTLNDVFLQKTGRSLRDTI